MYGLLTTGNPVRVRTKPGKKSVPLYFEITIDTAKNRPDFTDKVIEWEKDHGTEVSIDLEGEYRRGQKSVEEFMKLMAVANPHVYLHYTDPDGQVTEYQRATKELPQEVEEIKPHPHGVELGILLKMIGECDNRTDERVPAGGLLARRPDGREGDLREGRHQAGDEPAAARHADVAKIKAAIDATKIMSPPLSCIAPIGEDLIIAGLKKEVEADFYVATSRKPGRLPRPPVRDRGRHRVRQARRHAADHRRRQDRRGRDEEAGDDEVLMGAADEPIA
jgi:DNA topoisomerase-6 subunit B